MLKTSTCAICLGFNVVEKQVYILIPHNIMVHLCTCQDFPGFFPIFLKPALFQRFGWEDGCCLTGKVWTLLDTRQPFSLILSPWWIFPSLITRGLLLFFNHQFHIVILQYHYNNKRTRYCEFPIFHFSKSFHCGAIRGKAFYHNGKG